MEREVIPAGPGLWSRIGPAWRKLVEVTREPSAFLSPAWVETWLECFGDEVGAWGMIWLDVSGGVAGCVILSRGARRLGPFQLSRSLLNTSGAGVMPEHNDVLVLPEHRADVLDDLANVLIESGADEVALIGARERLGRELESRWPERRSGGYGSESPYVDLEKVRAQGGDYLGLLSSNTRSQIRRSLRLYESRFGPAVIEFANGRDQRRAWLRELIELHEAVWSERGQRGAFGESSRRFHLELVDRVPDFEALRSAEKVGAPVSLAVELVRVLCGGHTIGMLYHLVCGGRVYFYQSGFAYHDDKRLKPGLVTHFMSVTSCLGRGLMEYDFLGGEPASVRYKQSMSTDTRMLDWVELPAPTVKMRMLEGFRRARRVTLGFLHASGDGA